MSKVKIFDECFHEWEELSSSYPSVSFGPDKTAWPDAGTNQMLFSSDTAYEFGGSRKPAIGGLLFTEDASAVPEDEVILIGPDIPEVSSDSPYARVALVRVNDDALKSGKDLYKDIRKIEYSRYHVGPEGFMVRISNMDHKEGVRISKEAVRKGLRFRDVGPFYVEEYKKHPAVEAVKIVFITDPEFPYQELAGITRKAEDVIQALDHLLAKVKMDCNTCGLKKICDEVEQLLEEEPEEP